jgi:hypothetical protein
VDGKPRSLSKRVFLSAASRENTPFATCDVSWLAASEEATEITPPLKNPLNIGHLINHSSNPNVMYFELDLPTDFPAHLREFIPNVYFAPRVGDSHQHFVQAIAMVALKTIENEELFADYCFIGRSPSEAAVP